MSALNCCAKLARGKLFPCARLINITSLPRPFSSLSTSTTATSIGDSPKQFVSEKFKNLLNWYEDVTGIKEVRLSQDKVLKAEDRFIAAQDARRDVSKQLAVVREKLKDIYAELDQTSRGEDRYVLLITQEHKVLKDERRLADLFNRCEQEERENFSSLSSAVKESHEKERIQAERTKYWSIIGSIVGTMIGICGSSINNEFKMRELRKLVKESAQANIASRQESDFPKELTSVTYGLKEGIQTLVSDQSAMKAAIKEYNYAVENKVKELQTMIEGKVHVSGDGMTFGIDQLLEAQQRENRKLALVCVSSMLCILLMSKVLS